MSNRDLVNRFRSALARQYSAHAEDAIAAGPTTVSPVIGVEGIESPSEASHPGQAAASQSASATTRTAQNDWSMLVCAAPGDRTHTIVDWLLLACAAAGLRAEARPLASAASGPSGVVIRVGAAQPDGPVDVLIAAEHTQLVLAIEAGYCQPDRTTIVASSRRDFRPAEIDAPTHAVVGERAIEALAAQHAQRFVGFDAAEVAAWMRIPQSVSHGLLVGAALPHLPGIEPSDIISAIRRLGDDPASSIRALRCGTRYAQRRGGRPQRRATTRLISRRLRRAIPRAQRAEFDELVQRIERDLMDLAPLVLPAAVQVFEHGDRDAAQRLVGICVQRARAERRWGDQATSESLVPELAAGLAHILCYVDPAWQAAVRLRDGRLRSIRARHNIRRDEAYQLTDLIPSTRGELRALRGGSDDAGLGWLHEPVTVTSCDPATITGLVRLRRLRRLGAGRAHTRRHEDERLAAEEYARAISAVAEFDTELARRIAGTALLVQGSGSLRIGSRTAAQALWGQVIRQSVAIDQHAGDSSYSFSRAVIPYGLDQVAREGLIATWELAGQVVGIAMHAARGGSREETLAFARTLCVSRPVASLGAQVDSAGLEREQGDSPGEEREIEGVVGVAHNTPFARPPLLLDPPNELADLQTVQHAGLSGATDAVAISSDDEADR